MSSLAFPLADGLATLGVAVLLVVLVWVRRLRADAARQAGLLEDLIAQQRERHVDQADRIAHLEGLRDAPLAGLLSRRMGAIQAIAESIARDLRAGLAAPDQLAAAAGRGAHRAERLAQLAAGGMAHETQTSLATVWPRVRSLVVDSAGEDRVRAALDPQLPAIAGSGEEWVQILSALIDNAVEASPAGSAVEVGAARGENGMARLWVRDAGSGIGADVLPHVLEPGYASRAESGAEGLGLSMVAAIVASLGGHVSVDSAPGRGTRVEIQVPFATVPTGATKVALSLRGTVLVADDDPQLRRLLARMVRSYGAEAVEVETGTAARSRLLGEPERFAAAILDVVMPGTPVGDVVAGIRERRRGFPVVLISGYDTQLMVDAVVALGGVRYLHKPFTREELHAVLSDLLAARPATPSTS